MKYFYDRKSDSLYLTLADRQSYHESVEAAPGVVLDFDDSGHLIGIDLERASRVVDTADLQLHEEPSLNDAETTRLDGEKIRRKREQLGMSQVELARKLSVSPNTVARWERGELKIEHPGMLQLALASLVTTVVQTKPVRRASEEPARNVKNVHTVPHDEGWANVRAGNDRASSTHRTKAEAVERGREIAIKAGVEHVIHGIDGKIRDSDSYGEDPRPAARARKK